MGRSSVGRGPCVSPWPGRPSPRTRLRPLLTGQPLYRWSQTTLKYVLALIGYGLLKETVWYERGWLGDQELAFGFDPGSGEYLNSSRALSPLGENICHSITIDDVGRGHPPSPV
ncbi:hypothetical protein EVAR_82155_1 [Eumeta japonica]|uniref:Uncharacterized protein n=1 Tax=Eumeta variegata TaxID=151549 RepID=A0A4C1U1U7_EUMVA|nr:hypothetical protein EVAR_82155_1 [Eumeta japonica]